MHDGEMRDPEFQSLDALFPPNQTLSRNLITVCGPRRASVVERKGDPWESRQEAHGYG